MKKLLLTGLLGASFGAVAATSTYTDATGDHLWGTAENWEPVGVPVADSEVVMTKGLTVVISDADIDGANAVASITLADGATNVYTSVKPLTTLYYGTRGTIVKRSAATWTLTTRQNKYYSDFVIEAGVVTNAVEAGTGWPWNENTQRVVVIADGAMLVNAYKNGFGMRYVHIAGTGVNGEGALVNLPGISLTIPRLVLDADAKITGDGILIQNYSDGCKSSFDFGGHTLTMDMPKGEYDPSLRLTCGSMKGPGLLSVTRGYVTIYPGTFSVNGVSVPTPFLIDDPTVTFRLANNTGIQLQDDSPAIAAALEVVAGACASLSHVHRNSCVCEANELTNRWSGPITLGAGATLSVSTQISNGIGLPISVAGPISGDGNLELLGRDRPSLSTLLGGAELAMSNSTFTGSVTIADNQNLGPVYLCYSNSVPDYSKVSLPNGYLTARIRAGEHAWSPLSLVALSDGVGEGWGAEAYLTIDGSKTETGIYRIDATNVNGSVAGEVLRLGAAGGTVELSGAFEKPLSLASFSGTLKLTDGFEATLTNSVASSVGTNAFGTLLVDGAKRVTLGRDGLWIGTPHFHTSSAWPISLSPVGRAVVRNALVDTDCFGNDYMEEHEEYENLIDSAICVGWNRRGILEIEDGAVISNRFVVGAGYSSSYPVPTLMNHSSYGYGSVFQRGGDVTIYGCKYWGNTGRGSIFSPGFGCYSYWEASGGRTTILGGIDFGGHGTSLTVVNGGQIVIDKFPYGTQSNPPIWFGGSNQSRSMLYVSKGMFKSPGETYALQGGTSGEWCEMTVDGPEALIAFNYLRTGTSSMNKGQHAIYNIINGGTFVAQTIRPYYDVEQKYLLQVNFNGGTFRAAEWDRAIFGGPTASKATKNYPLTVVKVFEKGATLDTGAMDRLTVDAPIETADGNGVALVNWTATDQTFYGMPWCRVIGDGEGASVLPVYDSKALRVTGFKVLAPGCGYTWAKVEWKDMPNGSDQVFTNDCTLAQNAQTGGLTKAGTGRITLNATNTWGGATIVAGGTLCAGVDWALPTNTAVILKNGGKLDLNGKAAKIASVTLGTGAGTILNSSAAEVPASFDLAVAYEDVVEDGGSVPFVGDTDLSGKTLTVTGDPSVLDPSVKRRHWLVSVGNGELTGAPTVVAPNLPEHWAVRARKSGVVLSYTEGLVLLVK